MIPLLVSGIILTQAAAAAAQEQTVRLQHARFWRGADRTLLEGTIAVPMADNVMRVSLIVRDSLHNILYQESWTDTMRAQLTGRVTPGAERLTPFSVALRPGLYTVAVKSTSNADTDSAVANVRAFAETPLLSDLVASARIRALQQGEKANSAEIQKGNLAVERSTRPTILSTDPSLWYYVEVYGTGTDTGANAKLEFSVRPKSGGNALLRVSRNVALKAEGSPEAGRLPLAGLPPGDYILALTAEAGNRREQREAAFTMRAVEVAELPARATTGSESDIYSRYFAPEVMIDSLVNLVVAAQLVTTPGDPVPASMAQLTVDAQRRFLARYWSRFDPNPTTPQHELFEEYLKRVEHVTRQYSEQRGRPGVQTPRGRIYLKYGAPDVHHLFALPGASSRAVEVWKYTRTRSHKYAFLDESGFQHFNLVYTTDPYEQGTPDWADRVGDPEMIRQIIAF